MTQAVREAYASAPDGVVLLHALTLTHAAWPGTLDVVQDIAQHTLTDETGSARVYLPIPFSFSLPEVSESAAAQITVEIDNVPRDVAALLDQAAASAGVITLAYRAWLSTDTLAPAYGPLTLIVHEASASIDKISLRASAQDVSNRAFPNLDYTATKYPGLVS